MTNAFMKPVPAFFFLAAMHFSSNAFADKYGIHEALAETGETTWGVVVLAVLILLYVHFTDKN